MCFELYVPIYKVSEKPGLKLSRGANYSKHTPAIEIRNVSMPVKISKSVQLMELDQEDNSTSELS